MSKAFSEGEYTCPQQVVDTVSGADIEDALAIHIMEELIAKRHTLELQAEVNAIMSKLTAQEKSQLIATSLRYPTTSLVSLIDCLMEYREKKNEKPSVEVSQE
jgi:hypothetical protein